MRKAITTLASAAATILFVSTIDAPSNAQVASTGGREKFIKTLQFVGDQPPLTTQSLYVVPNGKGFRITDLIATNGSSQGNCLVKLFGKTGEFIVPTGATSSFNFTSGPTYAGGEAVLLGNNARIGGGSNVCALTYTVMGYLFNP